MLEINSYESIRIADIPYDSNKGLQTQDIKKVKEETGEVGDRMF